MKNFFVFSVVALTLLMFTELSAQNDSTKFIPKKVFALQFQIGSDFTLGSFNGNTISAKYHFSNSNAVRLGITLNLDSHDETYSYFLKDSLVQKSYMNLSRNIITINLQYLFYKQGTTDIWYYFGGGPFIGTNFNKNDNHNVKGQKGYAKRDETSFGINLLFGTEWFVSKNFSLSAEYGLSIRNYKETHEDKNSFYETLHKNDRKGTSLNYNSIRLGLSVYF